MPEKSTAAPRLFGDLLARARLAWVHQMASRLEREGFSDYRRSDAAVLRVLRHGPVPVGQLTAVLGATRQAARKVVDGLASRGFARTERDVRDSRKLNVVLTPSGESYAQAVIEAIEALNRELAQRTDPDQLAAAEAVLRAVIAAEAEVALNSGLSRLGPE
ncbi:MAG: MarR family transcriptional regulator [Acidimicrobiales bacterium]